MALKIKIKPQLPKKADIYSFVDKYFGYLVTVIVFLVLLFGMTQVIIPSWQKIRGVDVLNTKELQAELDESSAFLSELKAMRDEYDKVDYSNIKRIERLLPRGLDKERLFLQLQTFGDDLGLTVTAITITGNEATTNATRRQTSTVVDTTSRVQEAVITVTIQGLANYEDFKKLLHAIESYSPVLELTSVQYPPAAAGNSFTFTTYYLSE